MGRTSPPRSTSASAVCGCVGAAWVPVRCSRPDSQLANPEGRKVHIRVNDHEAPFSMRVRPRSRCSPPAFAARGPCYQRVTRFGPHASSAWPARHFSSANRAKTPTPSSGTGRTTRATPMRARRREAIYATPLRWKIFACRPSRSPRRWPARRSIAFAPRPTSIRTRGPASRAPAGAEIAACRDAVLAGPLTRPARPQARSGSILPGGGPARRRKRGILVRCSGSGKGDVEGGGCREGWRKPVWRVEGGVSAPCRGGMAEAAPSVEGLLHPSSRVKPPQRP